MLAFIRFSCAVGYPKILLPGEGSQLVKGCWSRVVGQGLLVKGCWSRVVGQGLLVKGCWSRVVGQGLLVKGCWSKVVRKCSYVSMMSNIG